MLVRALMVDSCWVEHWSVRALIVAIHYRLSTIY